MRRCTSPIEVAGMTIRIEALPYISGGWRMESSSSCARQASDSKLHAAPLSHCTCIMPSDCTAAFRLHAPLHGLGLMDFHAAFESLHVQPLHSHWHRISVPSCERQREGWSLLHSAMENLKPLQWSSAVYILSTMLNWNPPSYSNAVANTIIVMLRVRVMPAAGTG